MSTAKVASDSQAGDTRRSARRARGDTPVRLAIAGRSLGYGGKRARVAVLGLCVLAAVLWLRGPPSAATDMDAALAASLERRGLTLAPDPERVVWLAPAAGPLALRPALFIARRPGELGDVYYADVRASTVSQNASAVLDLFFLTNLTRSSSAAESSLTRAGEHVAFSVSVGGQTEAVVVLDTRGEPAQLTRAWPLYARVQNAITNLQETGRLRGFGRQRYQFSPPSSALSLSARDEHFVASPGEGLGANPHDAERVVIDPRQLEPIAGAEFVTAQPLQKGRPGKITWVVDTVRNLSFVGPAPIEWLEHTVFGLTDRAQRAYYGIIARDRDADAQEMNQALAAAAAGPAKTRVKAPGVKQSLLSSADPELGWPPSKLEPVLDDAVRGEGVFMPVADEAFVNTYPNAPPAFYQTFIRVDAERPYASVYVTLWDPRQVQLNLVMGTKEPESATGETGSGVIPRDPELLKRLVGAFNGGFQAMHGEFGMMAEGRVYLPPKPWAATVAVFEDGRVGLGSWPGPGRGGWDEERANAQIPEDMIAMRQNLTSVVEGDDYNPWKRWWWGAAPQFAEEQTYITRSGLCVTREGFMAFLWGESMGPEELGKAMLALRCVRGMHLDMNSKHTGFEFYRPYAPSVRPPALGRARGEMEFEGSIEQGLGFTFRSRLAVQTMTPLRFPRYLGRDPRDFFFLTLKPVLPGPALAFGARPVEFSTDGLPHAGWPHALARASVRAEGAQVGAAAWLARIDLRRAVPEPLAPPEPGRALAHLIAGKPAGQGDVALHATRVRGMLKYAIGEPPPDALVVLRGAALAPGVRARRALGIDPDGYLLYAEAHDDGFDLALRLREAGVVQALVLSDAARLAFAVGDRLVSVDGEQELVPEPGLAFVAETRPAAQAMFADVTPMPYQHWGHLQGQRVRYFPSGPPRFRAPEDVIAGPDAGTPDGGTAVLPNPPAAAADPRAPARQPAGPAR